MKGNVFFVSFFFSFFFKFLFFSFFAQHGVRLQQHGKHRFCNGVLCHWGVLGWGVFFFFQFYLLCVISKVGSGRNVCQTA